MPEQTLLLVRVAQVATSVSHLGLIVLDQIHFVFKMKFNFLKLMSSRVYK